MITVKVFAQFREQLGFDCVDVEPTESVASLLDALSEKFPTWSAVVADKQFLCAVNQTLVTPEHPLKEGDEVAFFPPVTGG